MTDMFRAHWQLAGHTGQLSSPELRGTIDLSKPGAGLTGLHVLGHDWTPQRILGVAIPRLEPDQADVLVDRYQRGDDLVATYAQTQDRPVRVQLYWRAIATALDAPQAPAIDLIVSVQTSLLKANPSLTTATGLTAGHVLRLADPDRIRFDPLVLPAASAWLLARDGRPACFLYRPRGASLSYVEMVHPADFQASEWTADADRLNCANRLFSGDLEKGVILRARVRGAFVPRSGDEELAARAYRAFAVCEPPLTT
ncbi:MAG: hypothetical protein WD847_12395 [Pirellulales bacterium]